MRNWITVRHDIITVAHRNFFYVSFSCFHTFDFQLLMSAFPMLFQISYTRFYKQCFFSGVVNPFLASVPIFPVQASENQIFSGVFLGFKMGTFPINRLIIFFTFPKIWDPLPSLFALACFYWQGGLISTFVFFKFVVLLKICINKTWLLLLSLLTNIKGRMLVFLVPFHSVYSYDSWVNIPAARWNLILDFTKSASDSH